MRIFVYGTLLDPAVLALVLGRPVERLAVTPAMLSGYRRRRALGAWFPVLEPAAGGSVDGVVIEGLSAQDVARLRYYETDAYELAACTVRVGGGQAEGGEIAAYVFQPTAALSPSGEDWSIAAWSAAERDRALAETKAFMADFPIGGFPLGARARPPALVSVLAA